jgi:ABC-type sulfate transport system permease component
MLTSRRGGTDVRRNPPMEVKPEIEAMLEQVILDQMLLGIIVVNLVLLLLLPFLLMMAGIGAAMLLWFVTSAAVLGALAFWLLFSGTYGLAARVLVLVIGLLLVDRQSRHSAY